MNFNDILDEIYVDEEFPVKTHDSATRRKKTYFKAKKRYDMVRQKDCLPHKKKDAVLHGMMRKTCVAKDNALAIISSFKSDRGTVRRQWSANDKMNDYVMEV